MLVILQDIFFHFVCKLHQIFLFNRNFFLFILSYFSSDKICTAIYTKNLIQSKAHYRNSLRKDYHTIKNTYQTVITKG